MLSIFNDIWPYLAVYLATSLEGEIAYITAVVASKLGHTNIIGVGIAGFFGGYTRDMTIFLLSRYSGERFFRRRPRLKKKIQRVSHWVSMRPMYMLIFHRYMYGMSTATVASLAMSRMTTPQFAILCFFACLTWVLGLGVLGYFAADQVLGHLDWLKSHFIWIIGGFILVILLVVRWSKTLHSSQT